MHLAVEKNNVHNFDCYFKVAKRVTDLTGMIK